MDEAGPGSLKCVTASSGERSLRAGVQQALLAHVRDDDVRHLYDNVFLVYTEADPEAVRDWLRPALREHESAFVVEFERWSSAGAAADQRWLLRRGH